PKVYGYYHNYLGKLYAHSPHLRKNFSKSIFPCCAINCSPKAWTHCHCDSMNCPFGMCAITALGQFDPSKGGHLVLPDLKLIVEFPVSSIILIPSATLIHANIPIQSHEAQASFMQYAASSLFHYVDDGFMMEKALKEKNHEEYLRVCSLKKTRWERGLNLLSKISELVDLKT
ncbi:hypothetical protein CPB84DRAFT_1689416, partial [Gymnopilus junonius]